MRLRHLLDSRGARLGKEERARGLTAAVTVLLIAFTLIYLPDVGHGFIKDDFGWIDGSRSRSLTDLLALFTNNVGFFRPLVSVSFAADYALWGLSPRGYGVTNFALVLACALLLFMLVRRLGLTTGAAVVGVAVWAFNFHAVNMALLWLSGRTAVIVTLLSLATALALLRSSRLAAGLLCLGALLSKEEATLLPPLFSIFYVFDSSAPIAVRLRDALRQCWSLWVALVGYAILRTRSGAFGPLDAPSYYQFSLTPGPVFQNVFEYADRAATVGALIIVVLILAVARQRPHFAEDERRTVRLAIIWIVATYALTIFLPIRSSLYALLPSIGTGLAAAAVASWASKVSAIRFRKAVTAFVILAVLLVPVYRSRNVRWVALGDVSAGVMGTLESEAAQRSEGGRIVLIEAPNERFNLDSTFGSFIPVAVRLFAGPQWTGQVIAPGEQAPSDASLTFALRDGRLVKP